MSGERVVVAMSGGVDSSCAALVARDTGVEVLGVTLRLWNPAEPDAVVGNKSCCSPAEVQDAARVARELGIPHYVLDYSEAFDDEVVRPFVSSYLEGRTPNPCVLCNREIKFGRLLDAARRLGADVLVTGHYARIERGEDGWVLRRARDRRKDQSYFLFGLPDTGLERVRFPLGELTKEEVRGRARAAGLEVAAKPESQEICFVPDGDTARFVERVGGVAPGARRGAVIDGEGRTLGEHPGVHHFTIGQRRGLGLGGGTRRYVTGIDAERATVRVGSRAELARSDLAATEASWLGAGPVAPGTRVEAQIRSRHDAAPATVLASESGGFRIGFDRPQDAVSPGQAVVLYRGDRVLGGGWIRA